MTMLDDRPETTATRAPVTRHRSVLPTASWGLAARLARREVRRRPGRTVLVMILIALPVVAMGLASLAARTNAASGAGAFAREYGTADLVVRTQNGESISFDEVDQAAVVDPLSHPSLDSFPAGTTSTLFASVWSTVRADVDGSVRGIYLQLTDVDLNDPATAETVLVDRGRAPSAPGEALLSPSVAEAFGVDVGDEVRLVRPDLDVTVVGVGRSAGYFGQPMMVVDDLDLTTVTPGYATTFTLFDLPATTTPGDEAAQLQRLRAAGQDAFGAQSMHEKSETPTAQELAWSWVALVVAFVAVGIVVAAAFATSARRQLVTIGQLSANGASERLVRRTMALQGMWTGLFGVVAGVVVAIAVGTVVRASGLFERVTEHGVAGLAIAPFDFVVIGATGVAAATVSALVPAYSASRIPVLSALAGRRPVVTPPAWMAPVGGALFLGGIFLLAGAAGMSDGGDFAAMLAVIGALGVLFGIVCSSPLIVAMVGSVGARRGGVVRLASRSLGRSRARSAAVLTAIATVGTLAVAGATGAGSASIRDGQYRPNLRSVDVVFGPSGNPAVPIDGIIDEAPYRPIGLPADLRDGLERAVPDASWTALTEVVENPPPFDAVTGDVVVEDPALADLPTLYGVTVADEQALALFDLDGEQRRVLDEEGILTLEPWSGDRAVINAVAGPVEVDLSASWSLLGFDGAVDTEAETVAYERLTTEVGALPSSVLITEDFAARNGIEVAVSRYLLTNPVDLTGAQRNAIQDLQTGGGSDVFVESATAPGYESLVSDNGSQWYAYTQYPEQQVDWALVQLGVAAGSLVLVLLVVAIGLSLAATESRDERDVLFAVGAAPKVLRRVSAAKAWVLTTGAAVVAVPAGYVTMLVITRATNTSAPFPSGLAIALLIVVPAVSAGATLLVSATAQRFRPVVMSSTTPA